MKIHPGIELDNPIGEERLTGMMRVGNIRRRPWQGIPRVKAKHF
jgi:hypothetical protein